MIESSKLPLPLQGGNAVTGSISTGKPPNSLWSCRLVGIQKRIGDKPLFFA